MINKYCVVLFILPLSYALQGQGCSDAGFCTVNSFKAVGLESMGDWNNQVRVGLSYGLADYDITVGGLYIEYNRKITESITLDAKVTSISQSGNDISTLGLSDFYLSGNLAINENIRLTLGVKVPLTNGNDQKDGLPLPMDYQTSLGTSDILGGIGFAVANIDFVVAAQVPITQNKNVFFADDYPLGSRLRDFQSTNGFVRSPDILVRVSYPIHLGEHFRITPSVLPIYHLSNDKYTNKLGQEMEIVGSDGLTLNGNVYLDYLMNDRMGLQLNAGVPFIVREVRPDGLTRGLVVNLEYRFKF